MGGGIFNWVDVAIGIFVIIALVDGFGRGFLLQIVELTAFTAALILAIGWYRPVADWLITSSGMSALVAKPVAFLGLWLLVDGALSLGLRLIYRHLPSLVKTSLTNRIVGLVPAFFKSVAYLGLALTVILSLPFNPEIKAPIEESVAAQAIVSRTNFLVHALERSLGGSIAQTFNFLTTTNEQSTSVSFLDRVPADRLRFEEELEERMLILINRERAKAGLKLLTMDESIRAVARAHSRDMWLRGYFDHINPDGQTPFDRMVAGGVKFTVAGENLALAPSLEIAHFGLMRSESHRENILFEDFERVGIGIVSAGVDGLMITQDFAN